MQSVVNELKRNPNILDELLEMEIDDMIDEISNLSTTEKIELLEKCINKGWNVQNITSIKYETLRQLLEDNNDWLAKKLIPDNCKYIWCYYDESKWYYIRYEDNNLREKTISYSEIDLNKIILLYRDLDSWLWWTISTIRAVNLTNQLTGQITKWVGILQSNILLDANSTNIQKEKLWKLQKVTEDLLLVIRQQISLAHSDIRCLTDEKWWIIKVVEWDTHVYLLDDKWTPFDLCISWDYYIDALQSEWRSLATYDCIKSTDKDIITTSHGDNVIIRFIDPKKHNSNIISWESKWGIIDSKLCEIASMLLKKWYTWFLNYEEESKYYCLKDWLWIIEANFYL